jgi:hypothetical protein
MQHISNVISFLLSHLQCYKLSSLQGASMIMCTKAVVIVACYFISQNGNLSWCWNFWIYLYNNIHNKSWEHMNKFQINLATKKYSQKKFK